MKQLMVISLFLLFANLLTAQDSTKKQYKAGITISLPWANHFRYFDYSVQEPAGKSGFGGLGLAFFYKTGRRKFSLNTGITADLPAPIGPVDYAHEGIRTSISNFYADLLYHHHALKKLNLLAGINYNLYRFSFISYEVADADYIMTGNTFGITAGAELLIRKNAAIAVIYRPALSGALPHQYRHLLSLDARFDINLIRK